MTQTSSPDANAAKLAELTGDIKVCMLTTVDTDGEFVSRPMAHQRVESDADLWFFAERESRKVSQIAANPHVGVALRSTPRPGSTGTLRAVGSPR